MRFWLRLGLMALVCFAVTAFESAPLGIPELARRAELIVRGKVEGKSISRDADGRIFTEIKLAVKEVWKGDPKAPLIRLVHGGGTFAEERETATGQVTYEVGEEVIGFFVWNAQGQAVTLSMGQGKFRLDGNSAANSQIKLNVDDLKTRTRETLR